MAKNARGGFKFTDAELEHMLDVINDIVPIDNPGWEKVWQEHLSAYPTMEQIRNRSCVSFKNLFAKKILLVIPTVLLMFTRPRKFQGKL
jgi:hypothetical protein